RPFLDCVDRYFDAVCPIIARHQWTQGGGVLLVQVENEYANLRWTRGKDMPTDDEYQRYVRDGLLKRGIDVPLITCVGHCAGTVECVNSHNPADLMPAQRELFPDAPLFSTEFWTGWYDLWGDPERHTRPAADVEYASWRCWAEAACGYNYYVYHGGTNFEYTAMCGNTTSYDYDAHIGETGRLTEKWRSCRRVALFAQAFKNILLNGAHRRGVRVFGDAGLRGTELRTKEQGGILFLDNPDTEKSATGSVPPYLPEVTLGPREIFPYVHDVPLGWSQSGKYLEAYAGLVKSDARVLTAHVRPDPFEGVRVFVYGTPGATREVALFHGGERGQGVAVTFADEPRVYPAGFSQIIALSTEMAGRTWFCDDDERAMVLFGPDDVRAHSALEATAEVEPGRSHTLWALDAEGGLTEINVDAPALPDPPPLSSWRTVAEPDYAAPGFDDSDWTEIDEPRSMLALGNGSNPYGWYRTTFESPDAGTASLHFAACSDRLTVWVNGRRVGSSRVPPEDRRADWATEFEIEVAAGRNHVCVLADNLGLVKGDWNIGKGQEQEKKGIYGPVTVTLPGSCYLIDLARWRFQGKLHGEREGWSSGTVAPAGSAPPRPQGGSNAAVPRAGGGASIRWHAATFTLDAVPDSATPLLARLDGMGKGVLWLNGHNLGRYWQIGPQRDYYMPEPWLKSGENVLVLAETEGNAPQGVSLVWDANASAVVRIALS
ncbi:MAG TPA: beta-galactosidase, partial [Armatimonadaceae bacterium]|nr:beta-galactosidase [Armatimonadaceae bacterium]